MINLATYLIAALIGITEPEGYVLDKGSIQFVYASEQAGLEVYVCGNFMGWKKADPNWRTRYDEKAGKYTLWKSVSDVKEQGRSFYEFTFVVNGEMIDANKKASNALHCVGHGYRYVIQWE
ncbi:MAG: hypothetical protein AAFX87_15065 [Bacteroidota bacterium]